MARGGSLEVLVTVVALAMYVGLDRTVGAWSWASPPAVAGTAVELGLVHMQVFRYLPQSDELMGVAPWLLPLYFAASVAVGAVGRRMMSYRTGPSGPLQP